MNVDHKIFAKVLANRLQKCLVYLIGDQQTGYMKNRFIGLNVRKIIDLLFYIEQEEIPALLVSIDFEKCFDTIEFEAIKGAMKYFGINPVYIKMVKLLYHEFHTAVLHNRYLSQWYFPQRGIHQGCSISGYIFLLNAEVLAHQIRLNPKIKGIQILQQKDEEKLSQFVDDMNMFIMNEKQSLQATVDTLEDFTNNTGLKTNFDKSVIYKIGKSKDMPKIKIEKSFKWSDDHISVLGITIENNK